MKRFFSFLFAVVLSLSLMPTAFAASNEATESADTLNALGLFNGTGTDVNGNPIYDLDKIPTRNQAIIMLVRLLGKEGDALAGTWSIPFTDVSDNMKPYIGYAYANGLTNGTSATTYSGTNPIKANQYITFVLRAMGYTSGEDFQVSTAWEFSDKIGLTDGRYHENTDTFLRSDIAIISASALKTGMKDTENTLFEYLKENGTLKQNASLEIVTKPLEYYYCNDTGTRVYYEDQYIQSAVVRKVGDRYQFELSLMPDHFKHAWLFPVGYKALDNIDDHPDGYSIRISLESGENADIARFSVDKDYFSHNPINRSGMVFRLIPIVTAFPDDFKFAEGCSIDCIQTIFNTAQLSK